MLSSSNFANAAPWNLYKIVHESAMTYDKLERLCTHLEFKASGEHGGDIITLIRQHYDTVLFLGSHIRVRNLV